MEKGNKPTHIIGLILIVLGFSVILGPSLLNVFWPRYIVLDPPVPDWVFIISEEKTVYIPYTGGHTALENEKNWTWRKTYYFLPFGDELNTAESILAYFDQWLNEQGWEKYEEQGFPCGDMTEADFLERGTNLFAYIPKDSSKPYYSSAVCVAIWTEGTASHSTDFTVSLFTTSK